MLSPLVLTIGKCLPSYWFIKANNEIVKLTSFTLESLLPIFIDIIIILGFALIAYVLMQFISRWQLKDNYTRRKLWKSIIMKQQV